MNITPESNISIEAYDRMCADFFDLAPFTHGYETYVESLTSNQLKEFRDSTGLKYRSKLFPMSNFLDKCGLLDVYRMSRDELVFVKPYLDVYRTRLNQYMGGVVSRRLWASFVEDQRKAEEEKNKTVVVDDIRYDVKFHNSIGHMEYWLVKHEGLNQWVELDNDNGCTPYFIDTIDLSVQIKHHQDCIDSYVKMLKMPPTTKLPNE